VCDAGKTPRYCGDVCDIHQKKQDRSDEDANQGVFWEHLLWPCHFGQNVKRLEEFRKGIDDPLKSIAIIGEIMPACLEGVDRIKVLDCVVGCCRENGQ
jgi:hypothetical protein